MLADAEELERATRRIGLLREEVWQPFHQRARVLAAFGYLDFDAEKITNRGRWLADLHVDRPLLVGEALKRGLFNALDFRRLAGVVAAPNFLYFLVRVMCSKNCSYVAIKVGFL